MLHFSFLQWHLCFQSLDKSVQENPEFLGKQQYSRCVFGLSISKMVLFFGGNNSNEFIFAININC